MGLAWKVLMPLALVNVICVLVVKQFAWSPWWLLPVSVGLLIAITALTVYVPRPPARSPVVVRGHRIGQPTLTADRVGQKS
jgi:NADH-quinone oxidoreductase subunit H